MYPESRIGIVAIILFSIFLSLIGCSRNELTREKASEIIIKTENYPKDLTGIVYCGIGIFSSVVKGIDYEKLFRAGLIKFDDRDAVSSGGRDCIHVLLTDKGKQYLINKGEHDGIKVYFVKLCTAEFEGIAGIVNESPTLARVEYNIKSDNMTPFAPFFGAKPGVIKRTVNFRLYDDGWRISN